MVIHDHTQPDRLRFDDFHVSVVQRQNRQRTLIDRFLWQAEDLCAAAEKIINGFSAAVFPVDPEKPAAVDFNLALPLERQRDAVAEMAGGQAQFVDKIAAEHLPWR